MAPVLLLLGDVLSFAGRSRNSAKVGYELDSIKMCIVVDYVADKKTAQFLKYGVPDRGPLIQIYSNHALAYDRQKRTPLWVAERITKQHLTGEMESKKRLFKKTVCCCIDSV